MTTADSFSATASATAPRPPSVPLDTVTLLGMRVDRVDMNGALALVEQFIRDRQPRQIVTADASMVVTASEDADFKRIVAGADLVTADGAGILWSSKRLGVPIRAKVSGVDLAARCCALSPEKGWRIYFFGSAPGVAEEAMNRMRAAYPGAQIVGARDGYFKPADEAKIVAEIREARPDILLVALGIPRQEKFIDKYKDALGVPVSIGVGGTLDVFAGAVKRAPVWMQKASLEWLYRIASNPRKRLTKAKALPRFVRMTLQAPKDASRR